MKLIEILKFAEEYLLKYSFSKPRLESEKLISHVVKLDRLGLYTNFELEISQDEKNEIKNFLKKMSDTKKSFDDLEKVAKVDFKKINEEFFSKTTKYLEEKGVSDYKIDAEYIFAHVLKTSRTLLRMQMPKEISKEQLEEIKRMTILRGKYRKPLQQIIGEWEFYGYTFKVNENVLIPRSDTENLVENCKYLILEMLENNPAEKIKVLDVGTGSGAIGISLGKEIKAIEVLGVDISPSALEVAVENKKINKADNVNFLLSDIFKVFENTGEKFNMIVSNPPYIPLTEYQELMPEVKEHEPKGALTDGGDGYYFYDTISAKALNFLKDGGYLAFEVGYNQAEKVADFMHRDGYTNIKIIKDYCQIERIVIGMKKVEE